MLLLLMCVEAALLLGELKQMMQPIKKKRNNCYFHSFFIASSGYNFSPPFKSLK